MSGGEAERPLAYEFVPSLNTMGPVDALTWDDLAAVGVPSAGLAGYLGRQRWAGARGGGVRIAVVRRAVPLPAPPGAAYAIAIVDAELSDGSRVSYLLPLVRHDEARTPAEPLGEMLVFVSNGVDRRGIYDGALDAGFRLAVHQLLTEGGVVRDAGATITGKPLAPPSAVAGELTSRVLAGEQSNTSIVYSDSSIIKLFRRIEVGENPDVEIGRAVAARADQRNLPRLLGLLRYEDAGGAATLAMRQELVPGARDVWAYTLDRARADIDAAAAGTVHWSYTRDAEQLGTVTRRVHEALAAETALAAFAPEPATRADVAGWAAAAQRSVAQGLGLLARQLAAGAITGPLVDGAANMVAWEDAFLARCESAVGIVGDDAGLRIRHHGDYHLGQLLRAESGEFVVIDFEGEPMRPLAERRAKHSALRDVAGMLRSFGYAAATVSAERGAAAEPGLAPDARAATWEEQARLAFRRGYGGADGGAGNAATGFLPAAPERIDALVALFETEKLFYELAYELQNRPDWAWIPLLGMSQLLGR